MTTDYAVGKNLGTVGDYTVNGSPTIVTSGTEYLSNHGQGGLVWIKKRSGSANHTLQDTVRGATKHIRSSGDSSESTEAQTITAFNSNGFLVGTDDLVNADSSTYVGWTFRKAPKFFDIVTYTGNGVQGRTISHNLDNLVGMLIIKCTSHASDWSVQHRMVLPSKYLALNETHSAQTDGLRFHSTAAGKRDI